MKIFLITSFMISAISFSASIGGVIAGGGIVTGLKKLRNIGKINKLSGVEPEIKFEGQKNTKITEIRDLTKAGFTPDEIVILKKMFFITSSMRKKSY